MAAFEGSGKIMVNRQDDTNNTLNRLNQALSSLEGRLNAAKQQTGHHRSSARSESGDLNDLAKIRARQAALASSTQYAPAKNQSNQAMSREPMITADQLRSELENIRIEMEREMSGNFSAGFQTLRDDLHGLQKSVSNAGNGDSNATAASQLRSDIALLKEDVARLARQDTLEELLERWTVVEREIANLPQALGSRDDLMQMAARLEHVQNALNTLPQSNDLLAMEEQVRMLAVATERMAENGGHSSSVDGLESRLDELSRAIAAIPTSQPANPAMDSSALERIEARIARVAKIIEESEGAESSHAFDAQFAELASRLDSLQEEARNSFPVGAIEALEAQIASLSQQIGSGSGTNNFDASAVKELDDRLAYIVEQVNHTANQQEEASRSLISSLDGRMAELANRIEANERSATNVPSLDHMAGRLEEIAEMLASGGGSQPSHNIANLEAQIAELTKSLNTGASAFDEESLLSTARLAAEEAVARAGEGGAGNETLHHLTDDLKMLESLARDSDDRNTRTFEAIHDTLLKVVDHLSGLEDKVNFSSADKMRSQRVEVQDAPPLQPDDEDEQDIAFGHRNNEFVDEGGPQAGSHPRRQAKQAAAAAAAAAMAAVNEGNVAEVSPADEKPQVEQPEKNKSLLKGMAQKLRRGAKTAAPAVEHDTLVDPELGAELSAENGVPVSDEPIEPGAGNADLSAIMRRVREERAGTVGASPVTADDADNGKSDFIAAARRAARAAAADATVASRSDAGKGADSKSSLGSMLASRRKPILMGAGAILLALLALPLIKGFIAPSDPIEVQSVEVQQSEEPVIDDITVADTGVQEEEIADLEAPQVRDVSEQAGVDAEILSEEGQDDQIDVAAEEAPELEVTDQELAENDVALEDIPEEVGPIALREAAVSGDAKALYLIGDYYFGGVAGQSGNDLGQALEWYEKSAELGYAPAQYRTGNFYEKGFGGTRDLTKAKTWYQMAASQGNAAAMHNLAVLLANGPDGTPDFASATRWFQKAAELGVKDSQFNLGILSAQGNGIEQNLAESYKWFAIAAKTGDKDAASKRDEVAEALRPEQLEMARGAVELWKKKEMVEEANFVDIPDAWRTDAAKTAATAPELSPAEMKKAVSNIQAILNKSGYDAGPVDGVMGGKTKEAIRAFQEANGLKANGEVTQELVAKLLEIAEKK
ncbi:SEL1-like repeat protein [Ahrensia marina]|uniref:SEL1-like repeat protein n=1 Tax=Ahrensia marina TaxID=1514904 RepID=UPI000AF73C85|nr:SEL1-like repeat protein [Ahrensia marina]